MSSLRRVQLLLLAKVSKSIHKRLSITKQGRQL